MTPNPAASLVLAAAETRVTDQVRLAWTSCRKPLANSYVGNLIAGWFTKKNPVAIRQILAVAHDMIGREADLAEVRGITAQLNAEFVRMYEAKHPTKELSLIDAHVLEETAEAAADIAEARLATRSPGAAQEYLRARRRYDIDAEPLKHCAEQILAGSAA